MGLPDASEARLFYRSALQRYEDAALLLKAGRTTGAVYLAGYCVECMLKALILSATPQKQRQDMLATFRGARAHNFDWLRARYFKHGGPEFPSNILRAFALVNTWDTDLRYQPGTAIQRDAESFLKAVEQIINWAKGRF